LGLARICNNVEDGNRFHRRVLRDRPDLPVPLFSFYLGLQAVPFLQPGEVGVVGEVRLKMWGHWTGLDWTGGQERRK